MNQRNRSGAGNAQRVLFTFLALLTFVGMFFLGCSSKEDPEIGNGNNSSDSDGNSSSDGLSSFSSSSSNPDPVSSPSEPNPNESSSSSEPDGGPSSSSPPTPPGANCAYQSTWCGGITFDNVKKISMETADVGATDKGQERPNCIYATAIVQIGNESGGISINGTKFATGSDSRCGGDSGHGWGETTQCASKFNSVTKADGGYYIYVPAWAGQDFKTTGGEPVCTGTGPGPNPLPSSSSGGGSACVEPMYGVPPNGTKSCIKKGEKCYTCNPDRGSDCSQPWVWQANSIDEYWYKEVSCTESGNPTPTYTLTCTGLAQTGIAGTAITQPTVKCNDANVSSPTFTGAPTWANPTANTYTVSATGTGNCAGKTASCGQIVVSAAPTASTLTCTGLATTGIAGTAITQPTVKCGTTTVTSPTFTGAPTWANPTASTYTVSATGSGTCAGKTASCGTIKVNPKLTCGNPSPASVIAGTAVTAPTVTCGTATVTNISWSGVPTYWSSPDAGTYSSIKATANAGDCSGQTATCGTLTVSAKLTCNSVTQAITTGQTPTKPTVNCGTNAVTSGITWSPTSINGAINTAQTIIGVTAAATCGGSNQTASCAGTITVTAPSTPSSSSTGGGGSPSYSASSPGTETSKITHYWDACKPSCSWSGKGGVQANSCSISGTNIGHSDSDRSSCDGGNAFTCMNQAPWKVGNISFGYVAAGIGNCGDCWQFDFPNGQVMVVMKTNIGDIKEGAKFDLMVPGGGVGDFNALSRQVSQNGGPSNPDMGVQYGGFRGACGWTHSTANVNCVENKCNSVFSSSALSNLKNGCLWYVETLGRASGSNDASWNNPTVRYKQVTCPSELTNKY